MGNTLTHARHLAVQAIYQKPSQPPKNRLAAFIVVPPLLLTGTVPLVQTNKEEIKLVKTVQVEKTAPKIEFEMLNVHDPIAYQSDVRQRESALTQVNAEDKALKIQSQRVKEVNEKLQAEKAAAEAQRIEEQRLEAEKLAEQQQESLAAQKVEVEPQEVLPVEKEIVKEKDEVVSVPVESNIDVDVLSIGEKYIGIPYLYGGTDPAAGLDCSGFTQLVYKQLGIDLPRTSSQQATMGYAVSADEAQPGDLVFMGDPIHHVAIYAGNGRILDARKSGTTIGYGNLWNESTQYRRVL